MLVILIGDGFFLIVSREVAARNRKRRKVIHDRLRGRIPGADIIFFASVSFSSALSSALCDM
jgi:hypothetical protein